jgi:predicted peptidase
LFLNLHSLSVHHNQYRGGTAPSASYKTLYEQYEEQIGAVVVTPLGRGPDGWYEDEALVDTLEVWADALAAYSIDRERVFVGGYSMGGFGTYRLTTLMPDAFAAAVSVVGPPSSG